MNLEVLQLVLIMVGIFEIGLALGFLIGIKIEEGVRG